MTIKNFKGYIEIDYREDAELADDWFVFGYSDLLAIKLVGYEDFMDGVIWR